MDDSFWQQVCRARRMSGDVRIREGLALWDRTVRIMTDGIRHQFVNADAEEVRRIRKARLARLKNFDRE